MGSVEEGQWVECLVNTKPEHVNWLVDTGERITTIDGKTVEVWEFCYQPDERVLSNWARHFRNHYCLDSQIDELRDGTGCSRSEYLNEIKFPDANAYPGPIVRAGDFGEILVADFLEYVQGFWVPRSRYIDKARRNESTKGCDIIGFLITNEGEESPRDVLAIFEAKAQFTGRKAKAKLQEAVDDSGKDPLRKAESLNAIKHRFLDTNNPIYAKRVQRFQDIEDKPYLELSGGAALLENYLFDQDLIKDTITQQHPNQNHL